MKQYFNIDKLGGIYGDLQIIDEYCFFGINEIKNMKRTLSNESALDIEKNLFYPIFIAKY